MLIIIKNKFIGLNCKTTSISKLKLQVILLKIIKVGIKIILYITSEYPNIFISFLSNIPKIQKKIIPEIYNKIALKLG